MFVFLNSIQILVALLLESLFFHKYLHCVLAAGQGAPRSRQIPESKVNRLAVTRSKSDCETARYRMIIVI